MKIIENVNKDNLTIDKECKACKSHYHYIGADTYIMNLAGAWFDCDKCKSTHLVAHSDILKVDNNTNHRKIKI